MSVTRKEFQFQEIFILILGSKKMTTKTSFGEYFDNQRINLEKMMQNKNAQLNIEWMEDYEKRKAERIRISDTSEDELSKTTG